MTELEKKRQTWFCQEKLFFSKFHFKLKCYSHWKIRSLNNDITDFILII